MAIMIYDATAEAARFGIAFTPISFEEGNLFAQIGVILGVSQGWKRIGYLRG